MKLSQPDLIESLARELRVEDIASVDTPMSENWLPAPSSTALLDFKLLQQTIGSLNYLCTHSRPDVCFPTNLIARTMSKPTKHSMRAARRIAKFLEDTKTFALEYKTW